MEDKSSGNGIMDTWVVTDFTTSPKCTSKYTYMSGVGRACIFFSSINHS